MSSEKQLITSNIVPANQQLSQETLLAYYNIPEKEAQELVLELLQAHKANFTDEILLNLACLRPEIFTAIHLEIVPFLKLKDTLLESIIFRAGNATTRDYLLQALNSPVNPERILHPRWFLALVWLSDAIVHQQIWEWLNSPPTWHIHLTDPLEFYPNLAGWDYTWSGTQRNLYYQPAYELDWFDNAQPDAGSGEECNTCGELLSTLFELNLTNLELAFPNINCNQLNIAVCPRCSFHSTFFLELALTGQNQGELRCSPFNTKRLPADYRPTEPIQKLPTKTLRVGAKRRSAFESLTTLAVNINQLGGFPAWLEDIDYPYCPGCREKMMFLAQAELSNTFPLRVYAFLCEKCVLVATLSQVL